MGKTSLALDITRHVAVELHKPVGVFALERRADELGLKLLSAEADIAAHVTRAAHSPAVTGKTSTPPSAAAPAPASTSTTPPAWSSEISKPALGGDRNALDHKAGVGAPELRPRHHPSAQVLRLSSAPTPSPPDRPQGI
jgi:hypothetical protein